MSKSLLENKQTGMSPTICKIVAEGQQQEKTPSKMCTKWHHFYSTLALFIAIFGQIAVIQSNGNFII